jgi:7-carboxy-7-deazaguanine synthase
MKARELKINETFLSLQGESTFAGRPCSFIRLMGCPLRCTYCDTEYAFHEGKNKSFDEVFEILEDYGTPLVEVTGGEPLAQKNCIPFLQELVQNGYEVLLETSGAYPIFQVPKEVAIIMDIKTPGSGELAKMCWDNMGVLKAGLDEIKFVICSRADFDFMLQICEKYKLLGKHTVLLSPSHGKLPAKDLAAWILESGESLRSHVRMQLQMHKLIWGEEVRGV